MLQPLPHSTHAEIPSYLALIEPISTQTKTQKKNQPKTTETNQPNMQANEQMRSFQPNTNTTNTIQRYSHSALHWEGARSMET